MIGKLWRPALVAGVGMLMATLQACEFGVAEYPTRRKGDTAPHNVDAPSESILGRGGMSILGGDSLGQNEGGGGGIGVNSFLWRASLDTISFMPLVSADPFGGVIITDWFSPPETQEERFKITVYILGRELRADGIRAAVFRQRQNGGGSWIDASVEQRTAVDLENAILTRARQLRIAGLQ